MDKSWIHKPRWSREYVEGVDVFLDYAFKRSSREGKILCPCVKCVNVFRGDRELVTDHLICEGFLYGYTNWVFHGESIRPLSSTGESSAQEESDVHDDMHGLLHDAFMIPSEDEDEDEGGVGVGEDPTQSQERHNEESYKFYKLLGEADQELYPGCKKFSKLSFVVHLFHIKCLNRWSNKSFTMLLKLLKDAFPEGEKLPNSFYETKKIMGELGLSYKKIDACPNNCMLYWKEKVNDSSCYVCGASRWKLSESQLLEGSSSSSVKDRKVAAKILRHFPLKQRLQRLFMSSHTASSMRWHDEGRKKDGKLRHPADSLAWKNLDSRYPDFSSDPRNVRLGLASDGFNPFSTLSIKHSTWPVVLVPYNLPPWMCMKQPYFILSLLISGPSAPGNDIDVYLQPLIDELKELWEVGIDTYDASSKQTFQMHAALLWTINDFPAYANLSGWSTKGELACPSCNKNTCSRWLKIGQKFCFMGHRRFLDINHKYRFDANSFDGAQEYEIGPTPPSGSEVLSQLHGFSFSFGKKPLGLTLKKTKKTKKKKRVVGIRAPPYNWKKKSIFFELPYWEHNLLRHNLDVMHIEKNICDSILGTLLNLEGKTKDSLKARLDLEDMGIRHELHPVRKDSKKTVLPPACYSMAPKEKEILCAVLKGIKVPDGYAANISRCVQEKGCKITGLKSHDNHILLEQILPLAIRKALPRNVSSVLIELCDFFRILCSKVISIQDMERLEYRIAVILCNLERIFPPSFFDVMVHLPIHLATEAKIAGPVHYRWMYPPERFNSTLKSYVHNRACPEGSIAEGYLAEESSIFCSRYLHGVESKLNRPVRNCDDNVIELQQGNTIFSRVGRPLGKCEMIVLDPIRLIQAHRYVLFNCNAVNSFLQEHLIMLRRQHRHARLREREIKRIQNESFHIWFKSRVSKLDLERDAQITEEIRWLARGPLTTSRRYKGFLINGFRFHTKDREKNRKTQNSGVVVTAKTLSFASARDSNPVTGDVTYYGVLKDIIELNYYDKMKVVLFGCDWVDVPQGRGIKKDEFGFTLVNFTKLMGSRECLADEPFVLASQAQQVFYVQDPLEKEWHVVMKTTPRDLFDMGGQDSNMETDWEVEAYSAEGVQDTVVENDNLEWVRKDLDGTTIEAPLLPTKEFNEEEPMDESESEDDDTEYEYSSDDFEN